MFELGEFIRASTLSSHGVLARAEENLYPLRNPIRTAQGLVQKIDVGVIGKKVASCDPLGEFSATT